MKRHGKMSLPKCDLTDNKACERILGWQDSVNMVHEEPFILHKNNYIAYELYDRIVNLSDSRRYEFDKGNTRYAGHFSTLNMMEFVLDNFLPENTSPDELDLIVEKISIIHSIRLRNFMS